MNMVSSSREARHAGPPVKGRSSRRISALLAVLVAVVTVAGAVRFLSAGAGNGDSSASPVVAASAKAQSAAADVAAAQAQLRNDPDNPDALTGLGFAYLARARETGDPSFYRLSGTAFEQGATARPNDLRTLVGRGLLASAQHNFPAALQFGQSAAAAAPRSADPLAVVADAQIELGRYPEAAGTLQRMVDLKPNLASYSRVSYLRELHGDVPGAIAAMTMAVEAGGGTPADRAYVQTLLGDLLRNTGQLTEASAAYESAQRSVRGYGAADVGLAQIDAAHGKYDAAARRLSALVERQPLPDTVALYGDVLAASGDTAAAAEQYALVNTILALEKANGVSVDLESARFAADHARDPGADPAAAVQLARTAASQRPTVYAADILAWALRQAGQPAAARVESDRALRLGTRDATFHLHRSRIEADLGNRSEAQRHLRTAIEINPALGVRDRALAAGLATELHTPLPAMPR